MGKTFRGKTFRIAASVALIVTTAQAGEALLPLKQGPYAEMAQPCATQPRRHMALRQLTFRGDALNNGYTVRRIAAVRTFGNAYYVTLSEHPAAGGDSAPRHKGDGRTLIWRIVIADPTHFSLSGRDHVHTWTGRYRFCGDA